MIPTQPAAPQAQIEFHGSLYAVQPTGGAHIPFYLIRKDGRTLFVARTQIADVFQVSNDQGASMHSYLTLRGGHLVPYRPLAAEIDAQARAGDFARANPQPAPYRNGGPRIWR